MDTVRFFFGAMSPYSWFAAERIGELIPDAHWRPVFAGGLFAANDRSSWGLDGRRAAKVADCEARAAEHGLGPLRWPDGWPRSDILIARAMAFAEAEGALVPFSLAAMRAAFTRGDDLAQLTVVQEVAETVALERDALAHAVASPAVKDRVRALHDEAMSLGVFGIPTVAVGDQCFWGDDRLLDAADAACSGTDGRV